MKRRNFTCLPVRSSDGYTAQVEDDLRATSGYDFRNNVDGDTYVFLLGGSLAGWQTSRQECLQPPQPATSTRGGRQERKRIHFIHWPYSIIC